MRRSIAGICAATLLLLGPSGGQAADIVFKKTDPDDRGSATLRLSGPIKPGDAEAMKRILARLAARPGSPKAGALATVELSSLGGDLYEGLKLGTLFRDHDVVTVVRRSDICLSACALAFLGGTSSHDGPERAADHRLEIGARLGFHTFYLNAGAAEAPTAGDPVSSRHQGFSEARAATAALVRYTADLGISPTFVATMMSKPAEDLTYVNATEDFLALRICPIGLDRPSASLEQQALTICNHSTGSTGPAAPRQIRRLAPGQAKRYMLENIQENMSSLKVKGALFEQLASYSVMRVEKSIDHLYADLRAAGVRLPEIVGPVFEVSGYQVGGQPAQCFVSLSPDDPDRYAVAIRRPTKWSHPTWSAPKDCRGLYRHDKDAVINPSPQQGPLQLLARPLPRREGAPASINSGL